MAISDNADGAPLTLLTKDVLRTTAEYIDVNPVPQKGARELLYGAAAVFASIRNLFLCPRGGRSRIYQEDYFSGLYDLLHEPLDTITAKLIETALYQALRLWEPRVTINPSDLVVIVDSSLPGYQVVMKIVVHGQTQQGTFGVPLSGASF